MCPFMNGAFNWVTQFYNASPHTVPAVLLLNCEGAGTNGDTQGVTLRAISSPSA